MLNEVGPKLMPVIAVPLTVTELARFTSMASTRGEPPTVIAGLSGTVMLALAGPLMWTGVPVPVRNVSSELTTVIFTALNVPWGRLPMANGSNLPEACVSSMRFLVPTGTFTAAPPPLGVRLSEETLTSKAITLSAGASPKRTCVLLALPGVEEVGVVPEPPPPQPTANASDATITKARAARLTDWETDFMLMKRISNLLYLSGGPS